MIIGTMRNLIAEFKEKAATARWAAETPLDLNNSDV